MISSPLPNLDTLDIEALKAMLIAQHSESLRQHSEFLQQHREFLQQRDRSHQQIEHLKLVIEKYRRMLFGSKSEKLTGQLEQLEFELEELETAEAATEAAQSPSAQATSKSRPRAPRKALPEDLPREVITHLPPHTCSPDCGGGLRQFGEDVSEQLERIPATYKVIQHVRPKFACAACEQVVEATRSGATDRSWLARPRPVGARAGFEVRRSSAFVPAVRSMPGKASI